MRPTVKYGLFFGALFIIIRLVARYFIWMDPVKLHDQFSFVSILLMLLAIYFGFREHLLSEKTRVSHFQDFKTAFLAAAWFCIVFAGFTFIYLKNIDPVVLTNKIEQVVQAAESITPDELEAINKQNPAPKDLTKEEYVSRQKQAVEIFLSPFADTTFRFLIHIVFGAFFALSVPPLLRFLKKKTGAT